MITLQTDKPIYLYAMGHYEINDIIEDLRILIIKTSNEDSHNVKESDVISVLLKLVYTHLQRYDMMSFVNFVSHLDPKNRWLSDFWGKYYIEGVDDFNRLLILSCLSILEHYGKDVIESFELMTFLPVKNK